MRGHPHRLRTLLALAAAAALLAPVPSQAKATCGSQIDKAALKFAQTLVNKAVAACRKSPSGTCYKVTVKAIAAKALKKCATGDIQTLFGGRCISRDGTCKPTNVATTDDVAKCLTCSIQSDVNCLTATAFGATAPPGCVGSPSGAFLDPDDGFGALYGDPSDSAR